MTDLDVRPSARRSLKNWRDPFGPGAILLILLAFTLLALSAKALLVEDSFQDVRFSLSSMNAVAHQLKPHVNIIGPLGQAYYWPYIPFAADGQFSAIDVTRANLLIAWMAAAGCWILIRNLASRPVVLLIILISFLVACSPRENGHLTLITQMAPYNRWCWALMTPIAAYGALPANPCKNEPSRAILLALFLVFLFLTKITFFVCAGGLLFFALVLRLLPIRTALIAAGVWLAAIVVVQITEHNLLAYWQQIAAAVKANVSSASQIQLRKDRILGSGFEGMRYGLGYVLVLALIKPPARVEIAAIWRWFHENLWAIAIGAVLISTGLLVIMQNQDRHEGAVLSISLLCAWAWAERSGGEGALKSLPARAGVVLAVAVSSFTPLLDVIALSRQTYLTNGHSAAIREFQGTRMADFRIPTVQGRTLLSNADLQNLPNSADPASPLDKFHNEISRTANAVAYIRAHGLQNEMIVSCYPIANEYPAILGLRPTKMQMQWWDYGRTYSDASWVKPEVLFSDATVFLTARFTPAERLNGEMSADAASTDAIWRLYGGYIRDNFKREGQTRYWDVWRRRPTGATPPG